MASAVAAKHEHAQGKARLFQLPVREAFASFSVVGDDLTVACEAPFVDDQPLQADGAARVDFVRADADLSSEAEAEAVGEAGAAVPEDIA